MTHFIAFCGPKTCGKDTAAKYLLAQSFISHANRFLFVQVNFADPLKQVCMMIFGLSYEQCYGTLKEVVDPRWGRTPREIMQNVAKLFRTMYSQDIWVRAWERNIVHLDAECVVVTDLRHVEEYDKLRELGAKIIYVENPKVEALRKEEIELGNPLWTDASEAYCEVLREKADALVPNDGADLNQLHNNVHRVFKDLLGDPAL